MEKKLNLKCDKTFLGFRKKCIQEKCALWVVLYSKNEKGETISEGMCVQKAHNIFLGDIARLLSIIAQNKE